jgi:Kef-type K+ transport system membrane component KefB
MLIEPQLLARNWPALAVLTVVAIVGKTVFVTLASMLIGERPDTAVKAGFAMGQVGTFSILFALAAGGLHSVPTNDPGVQPGGGLDRPPSPATRSERAFTVWRMAGPHTQIPSNRGD